MTQKQINLEQVAKEIDPINVPYIIKQTDISNTYERIQGYYSKGNCKMAAFCSDRLKEKIKKFDKMYLTPANIKVGDGVTVNLWSDRHAGTVIKVTKNKVIVRRDKAILDSNFKPQIIPGGFAGHCINQSDQKYTYELDLEGRVYEFHWSNKYCRYGQPGNLTLSKGRNEYYDYNF